MVFEVVPPRKGEVRMRDVLAVYGDSVRDVGYVDVLVVGEGGAPLSARIELTELQAGRRKAMAFVCKTCRLPRHLLILRRGALQCSRCHRYKTRRQMEQGLADWSRRGGREEDELLRLLVPTGKRPPTRVVEPSLLVKALLDGDRARLEQLRERLQLLTACLETRG